MFTFQLAQPNTPIHKWNLPGIPSGVEVFIKRDDMTGSTLSGNKVMIASNMYSTTSSIHHFWYWWKWGPKKFLEVVAY